MAFSGNTNANFPVKPIATSAVVPATAKTVFNDASNTAVLVVALPNNPQTFGSIFVQPTATYVAGRLMLYRFDGTNYFAIDDITIAGAASSATTAFTELSFTQWTPAAPLILPEGSSLLIASSVAQAAGSLIAHAQLGKVF